MRKGFVVVCAALLGLGFSQNAAGKTYYVSTTGSSSNLGTEASPWTIVHAATQAEAGDTVYVKGGAYGDQHVVIANSGTDGNPIVFEGYDGMPVLDGNDRTGVGILIREKNFITVRNLELSMYSDSILVDSSSYVTLEGIVIGACGNEGSNGRGIQLEACTHSTIRNCEVKDAGGVGIYLHRSDYCLVDNCRVYGTRTDQFEMDYYIALAWSVGNTIQNCTAEVTVASSKGNHGIGIKDHNGLAPRVENGQTVFSRENRIVGCTARSFEECFFVAHEAHHNEFINCYGDNSEKTNYSNSVLMVRDGAHDNTFTNCRAVGFRNVVTVYFFEDYEDSPSVPDQIQARNTFTNCIFESGRIGMFLRGAQDTVFRNCLFANHENLFRFAEAVSGDNNANTTIANSIIYGVDGQYDTVALKAHYSVEPSVEVPGYDDMGDVTISYTSFWRGFPALSGSGIVALDPLFADPAQSDYHLKSEAGRWNGSTWLRDEVTSPVIDLGDPRSDYNLEPEPNGGRVNMGAYGNTPEASKSPAVDGDGDEDAGGDGDGDEDAGTDEDARADTDSGDRTAVIVSEGCGCVVGGGERNMPALVGLFLLCMIVGPRRPPWRKRSSDHRYPTFFISSHELRCYGTGFPKPSGRSRPDSCSV